ncbi:MAG: TonB family protein [Pyrinomonadaceae bacterium]
MPLKIKTISATLLSVFIFAIAGSAQTITPANGPSTAEVMRERIAKAKAYIVVKNYNAAIYELENIKRESADPTLDSVINVLLMNSFLEQGDYKRAQQFLNDLSKEQQANKPNSAANYFAVAAQVIKSARTQLDRYHSMGLNVSDRTLPEAAAADVERMRTTLELVVEQSKELGKDKRYMDTAIALLEGATSARGNLAKDDYDANRWRMEVSDAREELANSRSTIINAVNMPPAEGNNTVAANLPAEPKTEQTPSILLPVAKENPSVQRKQSEQPAVNKPSNETVAKLDKPIEKTEKQVEKPAADPPKEEAKKDDDDSNESSAQKRNRLVVRSAPKTDTPAEEKKSDPETVAQKSDLPKDNSPLEVGPLIGYATKRTNPVYPSIARSMRMTGVVKVEILLDEEGKVAEVQNVDGPTMLQNAAQDAILKWKFRPFKRDGEPVKAVGFVSFNFSL